jgi:HPt (histidine-containing phosphotransfer) domain-containing protein
MSKKAQMIPPDAYPQMVTKAQAKQFSRRLRSAVTEVKAIRILEDSAETLREALLVYVAELEAAGQDVALISEKAHEIKGFADTARLHACARIAEGLCRYLEDSEALQAAPDGLVLVLHVSAIGRAARATNLEAQMSDTVAEELATLSARKLAEITARKPA